MLTLGRKVFEGQDSHNLPHRLLVIYKRKNFPLKWSDLVDTPLTKRSNLASPNGMGQND